jgi:hypothetical protein
MPSIRDIVFMLIGVFTGAFLILMAALMSAAGHADDIDEKYRGIRRS